MPLLYMVLTFCFAIVAGFMAFSRGAVFKRAPGQILQGVLSLLCFVFIGLAFWFHGWMAGFVEILVIFVGAGIGGAILKVLIRR